MYTYRTRALSLTSAQAHSTRVVLLVIYRILHVKSIKQLQIVFSLNPTLMQSYSWLYQKFPQSIAIRNHVAVSMGDLQITMVAMVTMVVSMSHDMNIVCLA